MSHNISTGCPLDEQSLIERMSHGDQRAFDQFFDAYAARLGAFAARRASLDAAALEDVVQVTMIKAMRGLNNFRGGSSLFTWLCQICRNHLADLHRKAERQPGTQSLEQFESTRGSKALAELTDYRDPLIECDSDMNRRAVRRSLNMLPSSYARILELRYGEDLSLLEIAQILRLTESAAESRLGRARHAFRDGWTGEKSAAYI
jgi:RNA polymerase sigma-70 factor (ECF subfamily)